MSFPKLKKKHFYGILLPVFGVAAVVLGVCFLCSLGGRK